MFLKFIPLHSHRLAWVILTENGVFDCRSDTVVSSAIFQFDLKIPSKHVIILFRTHFIVKLLKQMEGRNRGGAKRSWEKDVGDWMGTNVWRLGRTADRLM